MATLTPALATIKKSADRSYPVAALYGAESVLLLFAAGFLGRQDGIFVADAGLPAVCVDVRQELLAEMSAIYPDDWVFVEGDVYDLVDRGVLPPADVVSVDCPSGHFQICADLIEKWCALASRTVILGTGRETEVFAPWGWTVAEKKWRSNYTRGTYWTVVSREEK